MVSIDELKSLQSRVQAAERILSQKAHDLEEAQKNVQNERRILQERTDQMQKEHLKKIEETRKIADQLKRSDVKI